MGELPVREIRFYCDHGNMSLCEDPLYFLVHCESQRNAFRPNKNDFRPSRK